MKVHKGDTVLVISGKDRGKRGKVDSVLAKDGLVLVAGVKIVTRHAKARGNLRQAGRIEKHLPIPLAKVMLVCPKCGKPARVGHSRLEDGKRVRVCRLCKNQID